MSGRRTPGRNEFSAWFRSAKQGETGLRTGKGGRMRHREAAHESERLAEKAMQEYMTCNAAVTDRMARACGPCGWRRKPKRAIAKSSPRLQGPVAWKDQYADR
jgi:hypothetical protein